MAILKRVSVCSPSATSLGAICTSFLTPNSLETTRTWRLPLSYHAKLKSSMLHYTISDKFSLLSEICILCSHTIPTSTYETPMLFCSLLEQVGWQHTSIRSQRRSLPRGLLTMWLSVDVVAKVSLSATDPHAVMGEISSGLRSWRDLPNLEPLTDMYTCQQGGLDLKPDLNLAQKSRNRGGQGWSRL